MSLSPCMGARKCYTYFMGKHDRKIKRAFEQLALKKQHQSESQIAREAFENHPTASYMADMVKEIEQMYIECPEAMTLYKEQIQLIRGKGEQESIKIRQTKKEIIEGIIKKTEELLKKVEADYQDKEIWSTMRFMELERDELKSIIKNHNGEEEQQTSEQGTME